MPRCVNHGKRTTPTAIGRLVIHCCASCDVIVATTTKPAATNRRSAVPQWTMLPPGATTTG